MAERVGHMCCKERDGRGGVLYLSKIPPSSGSLQIAGGGSNSSGSSRALRSPREHVIWCSEVFQSVPEHSGTLYHVLFELLCDPEHTAAPEHSGT